MPIPRPGVSVRVLGCGDSFGSGGRLHTCFCLEAPGSRMLIDFGASALIAIHRFGIDPASIDAVVLSHLHGDHFGGLPFLLLDAVFVSRRTRPLIIAGPPGTSERLARATQALFPDVFRGSRRPPLEFVEHADGREVSVAGARVTPFEVVHKSGAPAFALRVACNGSIVGYSGDTAWCPGLIAAASDTDLFFCEASSFEEPIPDHLTYRMVAARRGELGARRLLLTHLGPDVLARRAELELACAADGQVISVRPARAPVRRRAPVGRGIERAGAAGAHQKGTSSISTSSLRPRRRLTHSGRAGT